MAIALFSVPTAPQALFYKYTNSSSSKSTVTLCSPSTPASVIQQEDQPPQPEYTAIQSGCKACGSVEMEKGCNGEGRIQGGIATVPGFGWWPIKAYRPCPAFVASGGRYRRQGQSMDEVAFGRTQSPSLGSTAPSNPSNKEEGSKKSKR